jgi:hypothetical protein
MLKQYIALAGLVLAVLLIGFSPDRGQGADDKDNKKLATDAHAFLKKYCASCHHGKEPLSEVEGYDVLDYASLTKKRDDDDWPYYVNPSKKGDEALKGSFVWHRAGIKGVTGAKADMPRKKYLKKEWPIPTDRERGVLERWLKAGAPKEGFGAGKGKKPR